MSAIAEFDRVSDAGVAEVPVRPLASIEQIEILLYERPRDAVKLAGSLRDFARATGDKTTLMKAQYLLHGARVLADQAPAALHDCEEALKLAEELGDREWQARICNGLGGFKLRAGDFKGAIELQLAGLQLSRELGNGFGVGRALMGMVIPLMRAGLTEPALLMLNEARRICLEIHDPVHASMALWYAGRNRVEHSVCARRHGDPSGEMSAAREAVDFLRRACAEPHAGFRPILLIEGRINMALALLALDDAVGAQLMLDEARALLIYHPRRAQDAACEIVQASIFLATSRPALGLELLESLLAGPLWPEVDPEERLIALEAVALAHEKLGQHREAVTAFKHFRTECARATDEASRTRASLLACQWPEELRGLFHKPAPQTLAARS